MVHIFFGNNIITVREKALEHIATLREVCDEVIEIQAGTYEEGLLPYILESAPLFGGKKLIVLDTLSEDAAAFEMLERMIDVLQDSEHQVVIIEGTLTPAFKKRCITCAESAHEYNLEKESDFNTFALTDALLARDKKKLWILLNEAWMHGVSAEELVGLLFWQIKVLRLAQKAKTPEEADLKPFVYQKAKRALQNFTEADLETLSQSLMRMYHDAHLGKVDMNQSLERWVLQL